MTDDDLKAIAARASTGENAMGVSYDMLHAQIGGPETDFSKERIEKIIAWYPQLAAVLRADVPALISEVRRLRAAATTPGQPPAKFCDDCGNPISYGHVPMCPRYGNYRIPR